MMVYIYSIFVIIFNNFLYCALWLLYKFNFKNHSSNDHAFPTVSMLVAVRNEEENIENLITDLKAQSYPKNKIQIIIGNDASEDRSLELLQELSNDTIEILDIKEQLYGLKGKMNVLAHLTNQATGDFLLLTDADMRLNSQWVSNMVSSMKSNIGMSSGFTGIMGTGLFHRLQNVDMFFGQGMLKVLNDLGVSTSVIGNNLIINRAKLEEVGGYQAMNFSIVEDVALMQQFLAHNQHVSLNYNENTYLQTFGESTWADLMKQRARWLQAFKLTPFWLKLMMLLKFSLVPAVLYLLQINPLFFLLFIIKIGLSLLFFNEIEKSVKTRNSGALVLAFEFFEPLVYLSTLIYAALPFKLKWKGREY